MPSDITDHSDRYKCKRCGLADLFLVTDEDGTRRHAGECPKPKPIYGHFDEAEADE